MGNMAYISTLKRIFNRQGYADYKHHIFTYFSNYREIKVVDWWNQRLRRALVLPARMANRAVYGRRFIARSEQG